MGTKRGAIATNSGVLDKPALRAAMRRLQQTEFSDGERSAASAAIGLRLMHVLEQLRLDTSSVVAVYLASVLEANIDAFAVSLLERGYRVVAPVTGPAPFYSVRHIGPEMPRRGYGVREPELYEGGRFYQADEVHVVLTPGLAFDGNGGRLGHGGGWYDRVLARAPRAIGVCYDFQVVPTVPREAHDQSVSAVVTERRVIEAPGQARVVVPGNALPGQ